ncbi:MAG: thiol:disulfide interchange protein DsbA/DsbL [Nitrosomonadales bacterium]|nr:thiol:disulfide interchange protein DsbA/DsbL [Nitrosomonadales bacterium]
MRLTRQLFAALALLCAIQVQAGDFGSAGYKVLNPPQPVSSGNKVEVIEFFFYECSHCDDLQGPLAAWEKQKPKDVELQMVPVIFRETLEPMARTYYALEAMGEIKRLHHSFFDAMHRKGVDLRDEAKITDFVAKNGVDRAKFSAAYNSFSIASKLNRSNQLVNSYRVMGTPTIAVDGKYIITGLHPEDTVRVLDEVIKIARKERSKH